MMQRKTAIDLKLYSSISLSVLGTAVGCDNHCQITVGNVTLLMTVNWLLIFALYKVSFDTYKDLIQDASVKLL